MRSGEVEAELVTVVATVLLAVLLMMAPGAAGQANTPACLQKLLPCASYLGSAKPAESCCEQLREAVRDELPCLCSLIGNTELLQAFHVNLTQALELPKHCGVTSDDHRICAAASTSTTSPAAPGGNKGMVNGAATARMDSVGVSGSVLGFLAFWSLVG